MTAFLSTPPYYLGWVPECVLATYNMDANEWPNGEYFIE